ncbi:MAG: hypothetical protein P8M34_13330 [Saprospiraceae bacterium]|nr:hypothetical protein [Saprospiraceae bacterium]
MFKNNHNFVGLSNMKNFVTILFSVFYLTLSAGVNINVHLCSNKLVSSEKTDCNKNGCCSNGETQSCCTEITYVLQLDNAEQICINRSDSEKSIADLNADLRFDFNLLVTNEVKPLLFKLLDTKPSIPLYTMYCSRLHYA